MNKYAHYHFEGDDVFMKTLTGYGNDIWFPGELLDLCRSPYGMNDEKLKHQLLLTDTRYCMNHMVGYRDNPEQYMLYFSPAALGLSDRYIKILARAQVSTIGELCCFTEDGLLRLPGVNRKVVATVKMALNDMDYDLRSPDDDPTFDFLWEEQSDGTFVPCIRDRYKNIDAALEIQHGVSRDEIRDELRGIVGEIVEVKMRDGEVPHYVYSREDLAERLRDLAQTILR
ncbi:hypothetical protein IKE79_00850 [Candidatus Saccharibacteria bacterium]|nr:hypothetical protein [Candidatus Saccharibacteria bacterium]